MTIYEILKNHAHRKRLREIVKILFEEQLFEIISKVKLRKHLSINYRIKSYAHKSKTISDTPKKVRLAFERLGPTFVKFGQLLSLRPDLIPPEYIEEFEKMQDCVPKFPFSEAKKIIETELGKPIEKIFTSFDKKPIASASIAQVYKAKIGKDVLAVKVQRPNIQSIIEEDIELLYKIAELLEEHIPALLPYNIKGIVHEFEKWTIKELNFNIEAHYAKKIAENFKDSTALKIPKIYDALSTTKVLVMEFIDGVPLHDLHKLKNKKINFNKVLHNGYYIALKQVFVDGFFHADPHPGNILILNDGRIGLIDFGILGHFDKKLKRYALNLFRTFIQNDPEAAANVIINMNPKSTIDEEHFKSDIRDIFEQLHTSTLEELQIGPLIKEVIIAAHKHHIEIPTDFVLYGKTISIIEGIALRYAPNFNFVGESRKILKELLNFDYFTKEFVDQAKDKFSEIRELVENFPQTAKEILEKAKKFEFSVNINDSAMKNLTLEIERSSGNIASGFMIAALFIASALVMQSGQLKWLYTLGFIISGILGLWLINRTVFVKIKEMIRR